jgi:hypothetical protein
MEIQAGLIIHPRLPRAKRGTRASDVRLLLDPRFPRGRRQLGEDIDARPSVDAGAAGSGSMLPDLALAIQRAVATQ